MRQKNTMTEVKVLITGFAQEYDGFERVSPSVVLIKTNQAKIIVDPGFNRQAILDSLNKEGITTDQIDFVLLTHTHLDHCALAGMFENAIILDNSDQFIQDGTIKRQDKNLLSDDIQIIDTPGHDQFHCSIAVKTEYMGIVVIAGDIFWWLDGNEPNKDCASLLSLEDPYVKDQAALIESRKKILDIADYIIPGHGGIIKVEK